MNAFDPAGEGATWTIEQLYRFTPQEFEALVARLWGAMGYNTSLTQHTRDHGVDVIATTAVGPQFTVHIQTKQYSVENTVGVREIREYASLRHKRDVDGVVIVASSTFSPDAVREAEEMGVKLVDGGQLVGLLNKHRLAGAVMDCTVADEGPQFNELSAHVREVIESGRIIQAIADLKKETGCGLKQAKELIDAYRRKRGVPMATRTTGGCLIPISVFIGLCIFVFAILCFVLLG